MLEDPVGGNADSFVESVGRGASDVGSRGHIVLHGGEEVVEAEGSKRRVGHAELLQDVAGDGDTLHDGQRDLADGRGGKGFLDGEGKLQDVHIVVVGDVEGAAADFCRVDGEELANLVDDVADISIRLADVATFGMDVDAAANGIEELAVRNAEPWSPDGGGTDEDPWDFEAAGADDALGFDFAFTVAGEGGVVVVARGEDVGAMDVAG